MSHPDVSKEDLADVQARLGTLKPLPDIETRHCVNCAMFNEGECRRFPPMVNWPRVQKTDWCGEWRKR